MTVMYADVEHLGQLVQAGVDRLAVAFGTKSAKNVTIDAARLAEIAPGIEPGDKLTQFITRIVDGEVLTEEIIRLANDFPTTAREKAKHDRDLAAKDAALTSMAEQMLTVGGAALPPKEKAEIAAKVKSAQQKMQSELEAEAGPEARVEYKKRQGNEMFKAKDYTQAAVLYTEAIQIKDDIPALWSNRCMCFLKLGQAERALPDAERCIALDPTFTKAHFRRGVALLELGRIVEALQSFRSVLDLDPANKQAKASMMLAEKKLADSRR